MERKRIKADEQKWNQLVEIGKENKGLISAIANATVYGGKPSKNQEVWKELTKIYGKSPMKVSLREFLCKEVEEAVVALVGEELAEKYPYILLMKMEGQYSSSMWRRSFRSNYFSYYVQGAIDLLCQMIRFSIYPEDIKNMLYCDRFLWHGNDIGYEYFLAYEIRQGNEELIQLLHETLMKDDGEIFLAHDIIEAVIISGHEGLLEDLLKLLVAARLQEGLRQSILESADRGSTKVFIRILKLCLDENFFRYSSTIRAFGVWTGLGYGDEKPKAIQTYARYAYDCLVDEKVRNEYLESENTVKAYFALWAQGCYEISKTETMLESLLKDKSHYRRVLGWLFVSHMDNRVLQMAIASQFLKERDEELLAWIVSNLDRTGKFLTKFRYQGFEQIPSENPSFPNDREKRYELFIQLKEVGAFIGNKKRTFTGNPFDFVSVTLENVKVYDCMLSIAGYDMDAQMVRELLELSSQMNVDQRTAIICNFLFPDTNPGHRKYLQNALNDRSVYVKETAVTYLSECQITMEDLRLLANGFRSKSSDFRQQLLSVFYKQPIDLLESIVAEMLSAKEKYKYQAAIEVIMKLKDDHPQLYKKNQEALEELAKRDLPTQTQILLDQLFAQMKQENVYGPENGYGLYDPASVQIFKDRLKEEAGKNQAEHCECHKKSEDSDSIEVRSADDKLLIEDEIKEMLPTEDEIKGLCERMEQIFVRHVDYEYEILYGDGSKGKVLFGDLTYGISIPAKWGHISLGDKDATFDMVPFYEEFLEALGVFATDIRKMLGLYYVTAQDVSQYNQTVQMKYSEWFEKIAKKDLSPQMHACIIKYNRRRLHILLQIFHKLPSLFKESELFEESLRIYRSMASVVGEKHLGENYKSFDGYTYISSWGDYKLHADVLNHQMFVVWRIMIEEMELTDEEFVRWFSLEYRYESYVQGDIYKGMKMERYFRAYDMKLITEDILLHYLLTNKERISSNINHLSNPNRYPAGRRIYEKYPWAVSLVDKMIHRMVEVEEKRGEMPTPLTSKVNDIERFEGAYHFCNLLAALGKESFYRGYWYGGSSTKQGLLSKLLKRCYPAKSDTPEALAELLTKTDISESRLAEAVMYAPQWAGFAEKILGWPGLKSGVWFFHAHINETFSAEKETEIAIYSPVSPQKFNDGAFDKHWFMETYRQLGEERFQILYKAAKYITEGSNQHRRSQLYTDAVLGRLDADELKAEIIEKRNQEKLRCYPLIPIAENDHEEALRRYEFIQQFLKDSKQFGAQRRDSEKKACAIAMENLAMTTGIMDVNRLMWKMESAKLEEVRPLMDPVVIDDVSMRLYIDEDGDAKVLFEKGGKILKSVPKGLNKNETYLSLKAIAKELKEQKGRTRESLEFAMMDSTEFTVEEVAGIMNNPVLAPMLKKLVWISKVGIGFLVLSDKELYLEQMDGSRVLIYDAEKAKMDSEYSVSQEAEDYDPNSSAYLLRLAHPHDLRQANVWSLFMRFLYEKKIIQPFKQVFREYYPITEDEIQERTISRRYAGHQVQPRRTLALLKGRGWTVDYEEGLQKVCYKENLIVRMYALADWFSPADIEAPTLEIVEFFDRSTGETVPLDEVPPILFSETMRDIDLVVSVAHVGGVDPETSHSTVEMRVAIAAELAALLKLENVSWIGSHAKIHGTRADYSVHMGSGVVHAEGIGILAIIPVHSQARGRIFLPFADDDPKTAEIMSKIVLLAEDKKIKDPTILSQIR